MKAYLESMEITGKLAEPIKQDDIKYYDDKPGFIVDENMFYGFGLGCSVLKIVYFDFFQREPLMIFEKDSSIVYQKFSCLHTDAYPLVTEKLTKDFIKYCDNIVDISFDEDYGLRLESILTIKFTFSDGDVYYIGNTVIDNFNQMI